MIIHCLTCFHFLLSQSTFVLGHLKFQDVQRQNLLYLTIWPIAKEGIIPFQESLPIVEDY